MAAVAADYLFAAAGVTLGAALLTAILRVTVPSRPARTRAVAAPRRAPGAVATPAAGLERGDLWPLLLVVVVAAALNLIGITWGLPNADNDWAIDSIAPIGPLSYAERMLYGGQWWSKYPPLHFTILALAYAPYVAFLALTGGIEAGVGHYPYGLGKPEISLPLFVLMARTVSAVMGAGAAAVAYTVASEVARTRVAGLVAGILFAASPLTVYYAHTANLDMPYMFWSSLALLCLVRAARGGGRRTYVLLGAFTAAAIATKDQAYGLFLLMPVPLVWLRLRDRGWRPLRDGRLLAGLAAALVVYLLAANVLIDPRGWLAHVRFITGEGSRPYQMFPRSLAGTAALCRETGHLVLQACGIGTVVLGGAGVPWGLRRRPLAAALLVLAAGSYLLTFLGAIFYVLPRFVLPIVFVLAIFAGIGAAWAWERWPGPPRLVLLGLIAYAAGTGAVMNLGLLRDTRYAAEEWMAYNLPSGTMVGLDGPAAYLPRLPPGVRSVKVEMTSQGPVARPRPEFLVLSDAYYRRYLRREPLRAMVERLLAGELDYAPVATFYDAHPRVTGMIPGLSPRIVILRRRHGAGSRGPARVGVRRRDGARAGGRWSRAASGVPLDPVSDPASRNEARTSRASASAPPSRVASSTSLDRGPSPPSRRASRGR
jgi:Dolichyl-phosphate-mannose-protein mannosyltransferase